jgi:hypothetical protein
MKNKQNERKAKATTLALLMLMVIVLPFVSCGGDEEEQPEPVGYAKFGDKDIPVYAAAGLTLTPEEVTERIGAINSAYASPALTSDEKTVLAKTKKIVIVAGTTNSAVKAGYVLNIGKDCDSVNILGFFIDTACPEFAKVIDNSRNTVRMAKAFVIGNAKSI